MRIRKKYSSYVIRKNKGARVNKFYVESSQFPVERWLVKNKREANKLIGYTEELLKRRAKRRK